MNTGTTNKNSPYPGNLALFTDLYELTMLQAYFKEKMNDRAVFSLFVRRLPENRNYLLACGLDIVLTYLENLCFTQEEIEFLASQDQFSDDFLDWLRDFRFTGDLFAVPEGTPIFANEPLLEVEAPLPEAQLAETLIMNQIHQQTVLASKASRVATAAAGYPVVDFGARRMHGIDTALNAARAFYIGGISATSNVLAGKLFGIPLAGTMAHSYIQAHDNETEALLNFARLYPGTILLVDTYDTLAGVKKVIDLINNSHDKPAITGVRLDSGDLAALARKSRRLLDEAELNDIDIIVSGGLNEYKIAEMIAGQVPVNGFGVGTHMGVSSDAPDLDIAYKLCEYAGKGRLKLSTDKPVLPGRKQIYRYCEASQDVRDVIARADESLDGRPLLQKVMRQGTRLPEGRTKLEESRAHAKREVDRLPAHIRAIHKADPPWPVTISENLSKVQERIRQQIES